MKQLCCSVGHRVTRLLATNNWVMSSGCVGGGGGQQLRPSVRHYGRLSRDELMFSGYSLGSKVTAIPRRWTSTKTYNRVVKLMPEKVEYRYKDSKFFGETQLEDQPYVQRTDDEMVDLSRVKLEKDYHNTFWEPIDINTQPYRQVLANNEDNQKGFTDVKVVGDAVHNKSVWFWVERLLPKRQLPNRPLSDNPEVCPSGFRQPPATKPDRPYFISRTRTQLLPVYRRYEVWDRDHRTYWRNRWDGLINSYNSHKVLPKLDSIKWPNNEKVVVLTQIGQIKGDIWQFEDDLRSYLESRQSDGGTRIMTGIMEVNGVLSLKGDYVNECVQWLYDNGF